jgi:hypothetical protein
VNDKVVNFPSHRIIREHADVDLIAKAKQKSTLKFADSITEEMTGNMIEDLENSGVDVETKHFIKDFSMVVDCLKATIYRHFELEHPLHEFIDTNVKMISKKTGELIEDVEQIDEEE